MKKLLSVIIACLCGRGVVIAAPALKDASLQVTPVVSGLSAPTTMAFIGPGDMLVLQKNDGKVRRVTGGMLQNNPVLDVNVDNLSERGLLGIALHPNFPTSPFVYLYLSESDNSGADTAGSAVANRVYRYTWNGSALTSPSLVLDLPVTPGPNHDGGIITFGRDNKLYVVIGDLSRNGQLQNDSAGAAPDDTSVVLRINADGSTPSDNPFFAQGGNVARYYAYGIRNSFGMAFDPVTDKLWMTENGPNDFDEINLVEPALIAVGIRLRVRRATRKIFLSFRAPITVIPSFRGSIPLRRRELSFSTRHNWADSINSMHLSVTSTMAISIVLSQTWRAMVLSLLARG